MSDTSAQTLTFPYPIPEYGAESYWQACNEERLSMQRCANCLRLRWHPSPRCGECGSENFNWDTLSGKGKINTWTVVTHPVHPAAVEKVPYVVVVVELDEQPGLLMISNLIDCDPKDIRFEQPVEAHYIAHPNGQKIPVFRENTDG